MLIDLDRLKVRTLFPENICVLKSKIVKTEERIKEINKNPNDIKVIAIVQVVGSRRSMSGSILSR